MGSRYIRCVAGAGARKTKVSGAVASGRQRAMQALRVAEQRVANRFGLEGLSVTRAVLSDRQSVEQTARTRGASSTAGDELLDRAISALFGRVGGGIRIRNVDIPAAPVAGGGTWCRGWRNLFAARG